MTAQQVPAAGRDGAAGPMTAIIGDRYRPIEGLLSREIDRPTIGDGEVLVRVQAAGLNMADVFGVRGSPFSVRVASGLQAPEIRRPGARPGGRGRGGRRRSFGAQIGG
jgi:hypothetical protein